MRLSEQKKRTIASDVFFVSGGGGAEHPGKLCVCFVENIMLL